MIFVSLLLLGCVGVWFLRRRTRRQELAGRIADRPTYTVEPPPRRVGDRRFEAL